MPTPNALHAAIDACKICRSFAITSAESFKLILEHIQYCPVCLAAVAKSLAENPDQVQCSLRDEWRAMARRIKEKQ